MIGTPVLREVARPVTPEELASPEIQGFIDDLIETAQLIFDRVVRHESPWDAKAFVADDERFADRNSGRNGNALQCLHRSAWQALRGTAEAWFSRAAEAAGDVELTILNEAHVAGT